MTVSEARAVIDGAMMALAHADRLLDPDEYDDQSALSVLPIKHQKEFRDCLDDVHTKVTALQVALALSVLSALQRGSGTT